MDSSNSAMLISDWIARAVDWPLGWLLDLPRDVAIAAVAVLTSLLLTLVRKWTTNQDLLGRCRQDLRRLKTLLRQAKQARDTAAAQRTRGTIAAVKMMQLRADGVVLVASLLPVALLATWAVQRLEFLPPRTGEPLTVRAYFALSAVDRLTHLVPPAQARVAGGAIQVVRLDSADGQHGLAEWSVVPEPDAGLLTLTLRCGEQAVEHRVRVGQRTYEPPLQAHDESQGRIQITEVALQQSKFLGVIPALAFPGFTALGLPAFTLAPWLVAYLLLAIALVPVSRRVLGVN